MGSLTEFFTYLNEVPHKLNGTKESFFHISVTENMKEKRKELKLYSKHGKN